jgi:hypothetical protein
MNPEDQPEAIKEIAAKPKLQRTWLRQLVNGSISPSLALGKTNLGSPPTASEATLRQLRIDKNW